jgi:hypothetical protein
LKNRNRFNFKEASNYLALYFLILSIVLVDCTCRKYVHNAETRPLPKVLVISSNMSEIAPDLSFKVRTSFEALPEAWYCKHYGSGAGTQAWEIMDTIRVNKLGKNIIVPLRLGRSTYCPYIIKGIYLSIQQIGDPKPRATIYFLTSDKQPTVKLEPVPRILNLIFRFDGSRYFFPDDVRGLLQFEIPAQAIDSLRVKILLLKAAIGEK